MRKRSKRATSKGAAAPRRLDGAGRVAHASLAALPDGAEALLRLSGGRDAVGAPGNALFAVLRDLLQLPASKSNGGAAGMEAEAAGALAAEATSQMGGSEQALWAVCAQLRALPELADCSDLASYLAKKYAPAAEREGKLVPVKNRRFGELARVVALSQRELLAEFDPDAAASDESDDEDVGEGLWSSLADELADDDRSAAAQALRHFAKLESMNLLDDYSIDDY